MCACVAGKLQQSCCFWNMICVPLKPWFSQQAESTPPTGLEQLWADKQHFSVTFVFRVCLVLTLHWFCIVHVFFLPTRLQRHICAYNVHIPSTLCTHVHPLFILYFLQNIWLLWRHMVHTFTVFLTCYIWTYFLCMLVYNKSWTTQHALVWPVTYLFSTRRPCLLLYASLCRNTLTLTAM